MNGMSIMSSMYKHSTVYSTMEFVKFINCITADEAVLIFYSIVYKLILCNSVGFLLNKYSIKTSVYIQTRFDLVLLHLAHVGNQ